MSDYLDYETSFDDYYNETAGEYPVCRCGTEMIAIPVDDPNDDDYEWVCSFCDPDIIEERKD